MKPAFLLLLAGLDLLAIPAAAHHSFSAEFDGNKPIRIEGTLSKIEWTNPHCYFYLEVKDDRGNVATWGCEGANPGQLTRRGFKRGNIKLGDKLIVDGYAAKDGSHLMDARRIYLNGIPIFGGSEGDGGPGGNRTFCGTCASTLTARPLT